MQIVNSKYIQRGFTLIEMAVVLIIVSILVAGGLTILSRDIETRRTNITNERMLYVRRAVDAFAQSFGYIPCPASATANFTDANFGIGVGSGDAVVNNCTAATRDINHIAVNVGVAGSVPFVTLGISPIYMLDGWNRRITYVVDDDMTEEAGYTAGYGKLQIADEVGNDKSMIGAPTMTLWPAILAWPSPVDFSPQTQGAALVLVSHGKNGHGAARAKGNGTITLTPGTDAGLAEDDNALKVGMDGTFRIVPYNLGRNDMDDYSDDILYYRTKWQLEARPE